MGSAYHRADSNDSVIYRDLVEENEMVVGPLAVCRPESKYSPRLVCLARLEPVHWVLAQPIKIGKKYSAQLSSTALPPPRTGLEARWISGGEVDSANSIQFLEIAVI